MERSDRTENSKLHVQTSELSETAPRNRTRLRFLIVLPLILATPPLRSRATESKVHVGRWKDNLHFLQRATLSRRQNSHETDMSRPIRISHRGGRGQDFDRSVSVR